MLPGKFRERIAAQGYIDSESLIRALDEPSPVSIRINSDKWSRHPSGSEPVPWCKTGFYLPSRPSYTLDPLFHSGCYYPQEASGMFLEEIFNQVVPDNTDLRILDLCGAPGGKAVHLSSLIGKGSYLLTNEVIKSRASVLRENITRWGAVNTLVTNNDPAEFGGLQGFFDVMLIDAPCSGEGMFRDTVAVAEWSEENTILCSERQKRILMDTWPALREDGILIYSTCTFNPDENEHNIKWLVGQHDAESIEIDITDYPGITKIDFNGINGYGFYPGKIIGEGLFFSVVRKRGNQGPVKWKVRNRTESKVTAAITSEVERTTTFPSGELMRLNDDIYSCACPINDYNILNEKLRIIKPGTRLFTLKNRDYLPSPEVAFTVYLREDYYPMADLTLDQSLKYLKRDNLVLSDLPKGWLLIKYEGVNLGFAKNLGNRINNYYPVEWRIRMQIPDDPGEKIIRWED